MAFTSPINDEITFSDPDVDGVVVFTCPKGELRLQFNWKALAQLQATWGEDFLKKAAAGMDNIIVADLVIIIAAASDKHEAEIERMSPPLIPVVSACKLAWSFAWNGGEPPEQKAIDPEKKLARLNLFGWSLRPPFVRV